MCCLLLSHIVTLPTRRRSLEYDHHNSGDIIFGNDGNMWVTIGDGVGETRAVVLM